MLYFLKVDQGALRVLRPCSRIFITFFCTKEYFRIITKDISRYIFFHFRLERRDSCAWQSPLFQSNILSNWPVQCSAKYLACHRISNDWWADFQIFFTLLHPIGILHVVFRNYKCKWNMYITTLKKKSQFLYEVKSAERRVCRFSKNFNFALDIFVVAHEPCLNAKYLSYEYYTLG